MAKILKNTTGSIISLDIGVDIPANGQVTLSPLDYDEASASDDIVEYVGSGDVVVNDGSNDLSKSDGIRITQGGFSNKIQLEDDLLSSDRIKVDVVGSLSDGKMLASDNDSLSGYLEDKIVSADNKITIATINDGGDEDVQISLESSNINTNDLNNDANFIDSAGAPVQPSDLTNFETSAQLNVRDTNNRNRSNHTGSQLASSISDFAAAVQAAETNTSLSFNSGTNLLSFTNEDGVTNNIDLSLYLDDTNLSQITSGSLNGSTGVCTFTRDDSSTFTVDFSALNDQSFINAAISTHETSITNHDDVNTSGASEGDILKYVSGEWVPAELRNFKDFIKVNSPIANQGTGLDEYLSLSTTIPRAGNYKVHWSLLWSANSTSADIVARIEYDDTTEAWAIKIEPKDSAGSGLVVPTTDGGTTNTSTDQRIDCNGMDVVAFTAGTHTIDIDFAGSQNNIEPTIYQAVLTIEEWE